MLLHAHTRFTGGAVDSDVYRERNAPEFLEGRSDATTLSTSASLHPTALAPGCWRVSHCEIWLHARGDLVTRLLREGLAARAARLPGRLAADARAPGGPERGEFTAGFLES